MGHLSPDPLVQQIATRIRRARRRSGLYAHQVAELAGVGENTVLNIEHGKIGELRTLLAVARALRVPPTELFQQPSS